VKNVKNEIKIESESPEKKLQKTCMFFKKNLHTLSPSPTKSDDDKNSKEDNNKNSDVEIEASDNDKTSKKILNQYNHSSDITKCKIIDNVSDVDAQKIILDLFLVEMPKDFFQFYEFWKNISKNNSLSIHNSVCLKLVGPYDVLEGKIKYSEGDQNKLLTHWRYYYDPPEFQVYKIII
jgi:hypothetical protein